MTLLRRVGLFSVVLVATIVMGSVTTVISSGVISRGSCSSLISSVHFILLTGGSVASICSNMILSDLLYRFRLFLLRLRLLRRTITEVPRSSLETTEVRGVERSVGGGEDTTSKVRR